MQHKYRLAGEQSSDSEMDRLLKLSMGEQEEPEIPEPLAIYYTLTAFNMPYSETVGYINQPAIWMQEQITVANVVREIEAQYMTKALSK